MIGADDGSEEGVDEKLPKKQRMATIMVDGAERLQNDGDTVEDGQQLLEGNVDPHEVLRVMGPRRVQLHLVREVQEGLIDCHIQMARSRGQVEPERPAAGLRDKYASIPTQLPTRLRSP